MSLPMPQPLANMPSQEAFGPLNQFMNNVLWQAPNTYDAMAGLTPPNGQDAGWGPLLPRVFGGDNDPINPPAPPWQGPIQPPAPQPPAPQGPAQPPPRKVPIQRPPVPRPGPRPPIGGGGNRPPAPQGGTIPGAGIIPQMPPGFPGSGGGGGFGNMPIGSSGGGIPGISGGSSPGGGMSGGGLPQGNPGSQPNRPPQPTPTQSSPRNIPSGWNASIGGVPQLGSVAYMGQNPYPDTPAYAALRARWYRDNSPGNQPGFQQGNAPRQAYQPPSQQSAPSGVPSPTGQPAPGQLGATQRFTTTMATPASSQPNFVSNASGATRRQFSTLRRA